MATISGISGAVSTGSVVASIRDWSVSKTEDAQAYGGSNTGGGTGRVKGWKDWDGTYNAYGGTPAVYPGTAFTFTGSVDGSVGVSGAAICNSVTINVDIEGGAIVGHSVQFVGNGELAEGAASVSDSSVPAHDSSLDCIVEIATPAASPSFSEWADIKSWSLTISRALNECRGSGGAPNVKRVTGRLDATLSVSRYVSTLASDVQEGDVRHIRAYVNGTDYFNLQWMRCTDVGDFGADVENGGPVEATYNFGLSLFEDLSGTPTAGTIEDPASATVI